MNYEAMYDNWLWMEDYSRSPFDVDEEAENEYYDFLIEEALENRDLENEF